MTFRSESSSASSSLLLSCLGASRHRATLLSPPTTASPAVNRLLRRSLIVAEVFTCRILLSFPPPPPPSPRSQDAIVTWVKKKIRPMIQNVSTVDETEKILEAERKIVLGFFESLEDSQKATQSIIQKVCVKILGIGPALRGIASMSRADWGINLRHWKDEFVSALQQFWLGLKLLWEDVRISSRLLLKLAGGKSLSRRERQ